MIDVLSIVNLIKEKINKNQFYIEQEKEFEMLNNFLIEEDGDEIIKENVELLTMMIENSLDKKFKIEFEFDGYGGRGYCFVQLKAIKLISI